MLQKYKAIVN